MLDSAIQWIDWIQRVALTTFWKTGAWWTRVIFNSKECRLSLECQIVKYQVMPLFPSEPGCLFTKECLEVFCFLYSRLLSWQTHELVRVVWHVFHLLTPSPNGPCHPWRVGWRDGWHVRLMNLGYTAESWSGGMRRCESLYQIAAVDIGLRVYFTLKKPCSFVRRWDLCLLTQSNYKIVLLLHTIQYITIIDCIEKTWNFKLKRGLLQIN